MNSTVEQLIGFLRTHDGINDKAKLAKLATDNFQLTKDRSVYYCQNFAIRFSSSASQNFGNTVLSLSNLQKFDDRPFVVCLVTPSYNYIYLANTTFLKKISHSSQDRLRQEIINALQKRTNGIPQFKTENALGDYTKEFNEFFTETDVKTKIMILDSNPKAYNLDKVLEFLSSERSVFMFYFVGVELGKIVNTILVSMFQERLLNSTILLKHWAGRNSRGVSQFEGKAISKLLLSPESTINEEKAIRFLQGVLAL